MKLTMNYAGSDIDAFREQTHRQRAMPGVTSPSFICKHCQQSRKVSGRKRVPMGWVCKSCHEVSA